MYDPFEPGRKYSAEEYLELEATSDVKHEFCNGLVYEVGSPPQPFPIPNAKDVFISFSERISSLIVRPNVLLKMVEGPNELGTIFYAKRTTDGDIPSQNQPVTNPSAIVVLTSSYTFVETRRAKFYDFMGMESVAEIIWIFADELRVEAYRRSADGTWLISFFNSLGGEVKLRSLGSQLRIAGIYAGITFEAS